jgi:hypothetical protein
MERDISTNPNTRVPCCTGHRTLVSALLVVIVACTLAAVVVGFTERIPVPWVAICIMFSFFIATARYLLRVDTIFAVYYIFFYVYTVFTQIAYVAFPDKLLVVSGGQYYGIEWFWPFYVFTFASFLGAFLVFIGLRSKGWRLRYFRLTDVRSQARIGKIAFVVLVLIHNLIMIYYVATRFESLSYHTQQVLKSNKLFFFGFAFYQYTIYASYVNWKEHSTRGLGKSVAAVILAVSVLTFLTICVRAGQRIQLAALCVGLFVYVFGEGRPRHRMRTYVGVALAATVIFALMNAVRMLRGSQIDLSYLLHVLFTMPGKFINLSLEDVVFQDYVGPSLTLVTSMYYDRINPIEASKSLIANSLFFLGVPSLGERVSRFIDPYGVKGYGYYAFTEGFEVMGWAGFVYNAVVMNLGLAMWRPLLRTGSESFTRYMTGIMAMSVFSLARGTSSSYFKSLYMYFFPCIVMFCLFSGTRLSICTIRRTYEG